METTKQTKSEEEQASKCALIPYWLPKECGMGGVYIVPGIQHYIIPFSAFWLRSSVVSVLISLISDVRFIEPHDINLISFGGGAVG